jgi:hypothetical protein
VREVGAYLCVKRPVDLDAEVILTSVRFGSALLAEVDATSISKEIPKLASVWITSVNLEQLPTEDGSS